MFRDGQNFSAGSTPDYFGIWEDFVEAGAFATGHRFTGTAISSGTLTSAAANGGIATLSGAGTTDNSGYQLQSAAAFAVTASKPLIYKTRFSLSNATESDIWAGFFPIDTSIIASEPTDGIYFNKADDGTTISCNVRVASGTTDTTAISSVVFTAVASTYYALGIEVYPGSGGASDTSSKVCFSINDKVVHTYTGALPAASVVLAASVAIQSGTATGTISGNVDYIGAAQKR